MDEDFTQTCWENHHSVFCKTMQAYRLADLYTDVTIACGGTLYTAHKMILSMSSDYFHEILSKTPCTHPVIIIKDIRHEDMRLILDFMYLGQTFVPARDVARVIETARFLQIKEFNVVNQYSFITSKRSMSFSSEVHPPKKFKSSMEFYEDSDSQGVLEASETSGLFTIEQNTFSPAAPEAEKGETEFQLIGDTNDTVFSSNSDSCYNARVSGSSCNTFTDYCDNEGDETVQTLALTDDSSDKSESSERIPHPKSCEESEATELYISDNESESSKRSPYMQSCEESETTERYIYNNESESSERIPYPKSCDESESAEVYTSSNNSTNNNQSTCPEENMPHLIGGNSHKGNESSSAKSECDTCTKTNENASTTKVVSSQCTLEVLGSQKTAAFKCPYCSFEPSTYQSLVEHLDIHDTDRPFMCTSCSFRASTADSLKSHSTSHSTGKLLKCPFCPYKSLILQTLRDHVAAHGTTKTQ